jgi:hypothetical protein
MTPFVAQVVAVCFSSVYDFHFSYWHSFHSGLVLHLSALGIPHFYPLFVVDLLPTCEPITSYA